MKTFPLYRIYRIVWMAVSFFIEIYWFQKRHRLETKETSRAWDHLMKKQAETYKNTAIELEGLLIKLGQFMSSRADILPRVFIDELEGLVDQVPSLPWEMAKKTLEEELDRSYEEVLQQLSDQPVASASIGEVYQGTLHNGKKVAVKIQRREIEKIMYIDFKAIRIVVWLMKHLTTFGRRMNLEGLYRELVKVTKAELNFKKELDNGKFFRDAFSDEDQVYIPKFHEEYCTKKVLFMEWVDAVKVTDRSFLTEHGISPNNLADKIVDIFIKQFLDFGKFHADPHPGNLLVQENGTIVLIDFGMASSINDGDISSLIRLIEGLLFEDFGKVFHSLEELGFLLPSANEKELESAIRTIVDVYMNRGENEIDSALMEEMLHEITHVLHTQPIQLPSEFAFLGRAVSVLVGVIYSIAPDIDFLESARPAVNKWIESDQQHLKTSPLEYLKDWGKPLLQVPSLTVDYLKAPYRRMDWEKERQRERYMHDIYVSGKRYEAIAFLSGIAGLFISLFFNKQGLVTGCALFSAVALILYIVTAVKHASWIQKMR
ncbi:MAG TPA: AarF/UbiB family protein [Bacillales bacterium]|nr:AarF/UbiB family protein [Bacillales bacterium]